MSQPQAELPVLPQANPSVDRRERRGGGMPWWPSPNAGGGLFPYSFSAMLASKMGAFLMVAGLIGVTAVAGTLLGNDLKYQQGLKKAPRSSGKFAAKGFPAGTTAENESFIARAVSSLGLFQEANRGTMGDEAASADAAADASGGSKPSGAADSTDAAGASPDGALDPAKVAAALGGPGAGAGAGAGGADGRSASLNSPSRFASGFGGGGGSAGGGMGAGGSREAGSSASPSGIDASKLTAFGKQAKVSRVTAPVRTGRRGGSTNLKRLDDINRAGSAARNTSSLPSASATQTAAWEAQGAQGQALTGAGAGVGGQPGATLSGPSGDNGEPVPSGSLGGGGSTSTGGEEEEVVEGEDVTPWAGLSNMAQALIAVVGVLLLIVTVIKLFKWVDVYGIAKWLAYAALALSVIVSLIGIWIMAMYGQTGQGLIFTAVGAILAVLSYLAADSVGDEAKTKDAEAVAKQEAVKAAKPEIPKINADKVQKPPLLRPGGSDLPKIPSTLA